MRLILVLSFLIFTGFSAFADDQRPVTLTPVIVTPPPPGITPITAPGVTPVKVDPPKTPPSTYSSNVLQYREGNKLITMIPMNDDLFSDKRRLSYEVSQQFATKLIRLWVAKTIGMQIPNPDAQKQALLEEKTAEDLQAMIQDKGLKNHMPTAQEIVAMTSTAKATVDKLKDRANFLISFDELTAAFNKNLDDAMENVDSSFAHRAGHITFPSAWTFLFGFKVPTELISRLKFVGGAAKLMDGSVTFALNVRPYLKTVRNLDTGEISKSMDFHAATQIYFFKDFRFKKSETGSGYQLANDLVNASGRWGMGAMWGDYKDMSDLGGWLVGRSWNVRSGIATDAGIPYSLNIKAGLITSAGTTLTQVIDYKNFFKNGYFMVSQQFGMVGPKGISANTTEVGYAANLQSVTDKITIDQVTLTDLMKEVVVGNPGATAEIRNNELKVSIPVKSEIDLKTPANSLSHPASSGQESVPSKQ